ncbi:hypothetical protein FRC01_007783, partial [Tulasnella sp. 417]
LFEHVWRDGKPHIGRKIVISEARKWHRRIYGGVDFPGRLLPHELGEAAGYEAFQQWAMYGQVYRPVLRGEKEREKEALAGIAVGEANRLAATITPGQRRSFLAEAGAIAIGVAWKLRKEAKEEEEEWEEVQEEAIGRRGGRPRLRKRRSSFTYGEAIGSDSDEERLEAANLAVPGRYPPMAGGAGLGLRSPVIGTTSYAPAASTPRTTTILPQSTGVAAQAGGTVYRQPAVTSNAQVSIPAGHRRVQYVTSSGQPIQYVTSTGQPIVYVTPANNTGTTAPTATAAAVQPQYAPAAQQPQLVVVPPSNLASGYPYTSANAAVGPGLGAQPQYAVAGQQNMMPGQQVLTVPQQYTGVGGVGYPAYGTGGQVYSRPRAYSVASPAGGYTQQVF